MRVITWNKSVNFIKIKKEPSEKKSLYNIDKRNLWFLQIIEWIQNKAPYDDTEHDRA